MTCLFTSLKLSNVITVEAIKNFNTIHMGRIKKLPDNHCAKRIYQFIRFAEQDNQIQSIQFSISKVYLDNNY
jgi:hypothetical protein